MLPGARPEGGACPIQLSDAKGLLKSAIAIPNPVIFLENEILYGRSFEVPQISMTMTVPMGKARIWREGSDVTIVSFGIGMHLRARSRRQAGRRGDQKPR